MPYIYFDGSFIKDDKPNVRIAGHPLNYGVAAFEGMRALWDGKNKTWYFFRPDRHFERIQRGAAFLGFEFNLSFDDFIGILSKLLRKNNFRSDVYLRPLVFSSAEGVGMMKQGRTMLAVYSEPKPLQQLKPGTACLVPQRRPSDGSFAAKITGNYVLSYAAQLAAKKLGYNVGILLSDKGHVSEGSAMNLFWCKDGDLFTSSLACGPLAGVTRETVLTLSRDQLGLRVREGKYRPSVLSKADELFICGTGSGITPLVRFEKTKLTGGNKRSLTNRLWNEYQTALRARPAQYSDWFIPCI